MVWQINNGSEDGWYGNKKHAAMYNIQPDAEVAPPPPSNIEKLGGMGDFYSEAGKEGYNFYNPLMQGQVQSLQDIMSGKYNAANDTARSRFVDQNNAGFDANAEKIKNIWSGFGRSGSPLAANALTRNEIGRIGEVSNNDSSRMMNAQNTLLQLLQGGLNTSQQYGNMGAGNYSSGANIEAGLSANNAMQNAAGQQNLLNLLGSGIGAYGTYAGLAAMSSKRFKHDITPLADGLETIDALEPVRFKWNKDDAGDVGFIAEEIGKAIPEAVVLDDEGIPVAIKTEMQVMAHLVGAVQELSARVKELEGVAHV